MPFVVDPNLTLRKLVDEADGMICELPREPTARGSLTFFLGLLQRLVDAGDRYGALVMHNVGIVMLDANGERVECGNSALWCNLAEPDRIMAARSDYVAVRVPPPH